MKKFTFACIAMGLASGCVMAPENVTAEDLVAFDEAVASIGCDLVGESDYLPVELQTGLTREKVVEVAQYKVTLEEAVALSNGGVRLTTGTCTPAAPVAEVKAKA